MFFPLLFPCEYPNRGIKNAPELWNPKVATYVALFHFSLVLLPILNATCRWIFKVNYFPCLWQYWWNQSTDEPLGISKVPFQWSCPYIHFPCHREFDWSLKIKMCAGTVTRMYRPCVLNPFSFHSITILEIAANSYCKYYLGHMQRFCCI